MSTARSLFKFGGLAIVAAVVALAGCASPDAGGPQRQAGPMGKMSGRMAMASLGPTDGSPVRGLVMFHEMDGHLMVHARISGLQANAEHGFHVHELGSCASADGASAGGHFNPGGTAHGPQTSAHHAGDLPALRADAQGFADQKFMLTGVTIAEGPASVVGRAVIVHAQADDYRTQPTGNSGARLACGVIAAHGGG